MPEAVGALAAVAAGGCSAAAVLAAGFWRGSPVSMASLQRWRAEFTSVLRIADARRWLTDAIRRAGWNETADRVAILALALGGCLAVIGAGSAGAMPEGGAAVLGLLGF